MAITLSGCVFDATGLLPPNHNNDSGMTDAEVQPDTNVNNNNDACVPTNGGVEICDGADNNCNGQIDEVFDLQNNPNNCGYCGNVCNLPNATAECILGQCQVAECLVSGTSHTWWDQNDDPADGCEYQCSVSMGGHEVCDGLDNNCDGQIDEDCGSLKLLFQFGDAWTTWPTYVADLSGNGNNGVAYGGASLACNAGDFVPGEDQDSCSAQFNGVDGYIEVADSASLDSISSGYTIMAWVKPSTVNDKKYVFWKNDDLPGLMMWNDGVSIKWVATMQSGLLSTSDVINNDWTHLAFTFDGSNLRIIINGMLENSKTIASFVPGGIIKIGTDGNTLRYYQGLIDEIVVYNEAWSESKIYNYFSKFQP